MYRVEVFQESMLMGLGRRTADHSLKRSLRVEVRIVSKRRPS